MNNEVEAFQAVMRMSCLWVLLRSRLRFGRSGCGLGAGLSEKLPGDTCAAGTQATFARSQAK